jgi:hypothetical protein
MEQLEWTNLNGNFETVSRLIDKLPTGAKDLRQMREVVRKSIVDADSSAKKVLAIKPVDDESRFVLVQEALVIALAQEIAVILLGDAALTRAHQVLEATERLMRICTRAIWVFGILGALLGIYSAFTGIKLRRTSSNTRGFLESS